MSYQRSHLSRLFIAGIFAFAIGLLAGLVPGGDVALACSCVPPAPPLEALAEADAVFHGRAIRIRWVDSEPFGLAEAEVTFEVYDRWKGPEVETFTLFTEGLGAMCGYPFSIGERYIVYAFGDDGGRFGANICSRTRPYDAGEASTLGTATIVAPVVEAPGVPCPRCAIPGSPRAALAEADIVFHGWAMDLEHLGESGDGIRRVTFEVVTGWKGGTGPYVEIDVPRSYWGCYREPFRLSARNPMDGFIVYAYRSDETGRLEVRVCERTGPYTAEEAAELGAGTPPIGGPPPPSPSPGVPPAPTSGLPTEIPTPISTVPPPFPEPTDRPVGDWWLYMPFAYAEGGD